MPTDGSRHSGTGSRTGPASRQAIIDAGVELFADRGFDGTGVQEIVNRSKLTKGSFYYAFQSKEDLLRHIQDEFIDSCLAVADEVIAADHRPDARLAKIVEAFIALVAEQHAQMSIFFQESRYLREDLFADVRRKRDLFEEKITAVIREGQREGTFRNIPSRITTFGVVGMCAWTYHWIRPDFGPTDDIAQIYTDLLLNGLYAPGAGPVGRSPAPEA